MNLLELQPVDKALAYVVVHPRISVRKAVSKAFRDDHLTPKELNYLRKLEPDRGLSENFVQAVFKDLKRKLGRLSREINHKSDLHDQQCRFLTFLRNLSETRPGKPIKTAGYSGEQLFSFFSSNDLWPIILRAAFPEVDFVNNWKSLNRDIKDTFQPTDPDKKEFHRKEALLNNRSRRVVKLLDCLSQIPDSGYKSIKKERFRPYYPESGGHYRPSQGTNMARITPAVKALAMVATDEAIYPIEAIKEAFREEALSSKAVEYLERLEKDRGPLDAGEDIIKAIFESLMEEYDCCDAAFKEKTSSLLNQCLQLRNGKAYSNDELREFFSSGAEAFPNEASPKDLSREICQNLTRLHCLMEHGRKLWFVLRWMARRPNTGVASVKIIDLEKMARIALQTDDPGWISGWISMAETPSPETSEWLQSNQHLLSKETINESALERDTEQN